MLRYIKRLWGAITTAQSLYGILASEFVKLTILPILIGGGAVVLGLLDKLPLMYLYIGALFSATVIVTLLLRFDEWRERIGADGKLIFVGPTVAVDLTEDREGLAVVQLGAALENRATFPISYKVKSILSTADHTNPSRGTMDNMGAIVPAKSQTIFKDKPIDLKIPKADMPATLLIKIEYGHVGKEKYLISKSVNVRLRYEKNSGVVNYPWSERPIDNP
jgi:hypothetical protein